MQDKLRKTGIGIIGNIPWGSHFCQFYQTAQDLVDILIPYFKAGLESNEFCIWITSEPLSKAEALGFCKTLIPDFDRYLAKGQIEILAHNEWYVQDDVFEGQRVINGWKKKLQIALKRGYSGLRLSGNTCWLKNHHWESFTDYETEINQVICKDKILALCTYCLEKCDAKQLLDVMRNHEFALIKQAGRWEMLENASYQIVKESLAESEEKYRSLFNNLAECFMLLKPLWDETGKLKDFEILEFNKAGEKLTGISRREILNKTLTKIDPSFEQQWKDDLAKVIITGQPVLIEHYNDHLGKWIEIYAYSPRKGEIATISKDITDRKTAEETIKKQKRMLEVITCNTDTHLAYLDTEFNFVFVNPAYEKGCGYRAEDLIGKNHFNFFPNEENRAIFEQVKHSGQAVAFTDKPFVFAGQEERGVTYWNWTLSPVKDMNNKVEGLVLSLTDVTERKRSEESLQDYARKLKATNEELEAFNYSVSHDLRAPLRIMKGFSEALQQDYEDNLDVQGKDYLRRIMQASHLMSRLIDDLLRLSRIGRAEMHMDTVNLSKLARSIADGLKNSQPERQAEFNIMPEVKARGDYQLLQIALMNILGNAWKFTGKCAQTKIEFGTVLKGGRPIYYIRDNGAGFSMKYAHKLFQPFQRLYAAEEYEGTGIGLAIVQRIIHRHGGEVWAEGEPGKGATFYFTLGK